MKNFLSFVLLSFFAFFIIGCEEDVEQEWKIVMLTDVGTITDKSFNQGTWEGVKRFSENNDVSHSYFRPSAGNQASYEEAIDMVVANGANVVITPGYLFETAIYTRQTMYPNVTFILIDGEPHTPDYATYETTENTINILFQEEQAGFLAGYATIAEGYENIGFMGGMEVPAVQKFGIGYVAGVYHAANELNQNVTFNAVRYKYLGDFENKAEHTTEAESWYNSGVELIFVAAGGAGNAVMKAAENQNGKVIGVDVDQSSQSTTVISSAMKELATAVEQELTALIIDDTFEGGKTVVKGAAENAVGLPKGDSFKFSIFTVAQYDDIFDSIQNGEIEVPSTKAELITYLAQNAGNPDVGDLVNKTETEVE